ncbi:MAG: START domain-containing protein [Cytophagales bacterium]|nr:START domain-containing protein [Cytophagales bacterium]
MKVILTAWLVLLMGINTNREKTTFDWELKKEKNGVQIYARKVPGWAYQELKVTMQVESTLSGLIAVLKDVPAYPEWVYMCTDAYLYENSTYEEYYYAKFDAPWPVKHRDLIVHSVLKQDTTTKTVIFKGEGIPGYRPNTEGIIRIPKFDGRYLLVPKGNNLVDITYLVKLDPGGLLPGWLVNLVSYSGPFHSFVKLKDFVKQDKYQKTKLAHIEGI